MKKIQGLFIFLVVNAGSIHTMDKPTTRAQEEKELFQAFCAGYYEECDLRGRPITLSKSDLKILFEPTCHEACTKWHRVPWKKIIEGVKLAAHMLVDSVPFLKEARHKKSESEPDSCAPEAVDQGPQEAWIRLCVAFTDGYTKSYRGKAPQNHDQLVAHLRALIDADPLIMILPLEVAQEYATTAGELLGLGKHITFSQPMKDVLGSFTAHEDEQEGDAQVHQKLNENDPSLLFRSSLPQWYLVFKGAFLSHSKSIGIGKFVGWSIITAFDEFATAHQPELEASLSKGKGSFAAVSLLKSAGQNAAKLYIQKAGDGELSTRK